MRDERSGDPLRLFRVGLAALAAGLLSSCGQNPSTSPAPTPDTTPAFLHLLAAKQQVLWTFKAEARAGGLSLVDTKAVLDAPNADFFAPRSLAADPLGRFVYVIDGRWVRNYRVDGSSGTLTLAGEASLAGPLGGRNRNGESLAASPRHLFVGGSFDSGSHHNDYSLHVLAVDVSGALSDARLLMRDSDTSGGFHRLLGVDGDTVLAGYRSSSQLRALTLDSAVKAGYREIASVDFDGLGPDFEDGVSGRVVAADGRIFFSDSNGSYTRRNLFTFVLNKEQRTFDERGRVPDAAAPLSLGAPDRLAVLFPDKDRTMSVALYRVGATGALSLLSALPQSRFGSDSYSSPTAAFHPSGRFLYACGLLSDGSPGGSVPSTTHYLVTFSVGEDGALALFGSVPVAGCGPMVVTAPGS